MAAETRERKTRNTWRAYVWHARVCLCPARRCLPCSFLRSSINETRVQSRRMSNKYVSCFLSPPRPVRSRSPARPSHLPGGLLTPLPFPSVLLLLGLATLLVALLRESSSCISLRPMCPLLPPRILTLSRSRFLPPSSPPPSVFCSLSALDYLSLSLSRARFVPGRTV